MWVHPDKKKSVLSNGIEKWAELKTLLCPLDMGKQRVSDERQGSKNKNNNNERVTRSFSEQTYGYLGEG